jgi:glycosyltransferase involved in cell wall biosynthesis
MRYHSFAPHEEVVKALQQAHILAYPSIWLECNSASVIEAMSARCLAVHPNYGGLVDTSGGLNFMYNWVPDVNQHANKFLAVLSHAINQVSTPDVQNYLSLVKAYTDTRYNWTKVAAQWNDLLTQLRNQFPDTESRKHKKPTPFFHYIVK